jgi:hypothetical protein
MEQLKKYFKKYIKNLIEVSELEALTTEELEELTSYIVDNDEIFDLIDNKILLNYNFIKGLEA